MKLSSISGRYRKVWAHPNPDDEIKLTVPQGADVKTLTLRGAAWTG